MKSQIPRYSARARATGLGALACMAVLGMPSAVNADTTYFYTGSPYTRISTDSICLPGCNPIISNPNAAADAAILGIDITGSITFHFDTTGVSGTLNKDLPANSVTTNQFTSGDISWGGPALLALTLSNGVITDWRLGPTDTGCTFSSPGPGVSSVCEMFSNPMGGHRSKYLLPMPLPS
jgi:hypothetical protein